MQIGVIIKKLRIDKKIQSNTLYQNLLSRPAIAKFESGESDTTVVKFMIILDRLNISLEEFEVAYRMNSTKNIMEIYSPGAYKKAFYARDVPELYYLSRMSMQKYEKTKLVKYQHNSAVINLLISVIENTSDIMEDRELLQNYLSKCDYWSYYEITLFTNTLSFYSNEFIDVTYKHVKRVLISYQGLVRYKNELALLLFNILQLKITTNQFTSLNYYLNELIVLKDECIDNMYVQTIICFFTLLMEVIKGNKNNIAELYKIIDIFEYLEMQFKADQCRQLLTHVINHSSIKT